MQDTLQISSFSPVGSLASHNSATSRCIQKAN